MSSMYDLRPNTGGHGSESGLPSVKISFRFGDPNSELVGSGLDL